MFCVQLAITYSHQDGRERHIGGHNLMGGAYHKFHHMNEEATMDQGQGSPTVGHM